LILDIGQGECSGIGKNILSSNGTSRASFRDKIKHVEYDNMKSRGLGDTKSWVNFSRLDGQNPFVYAGTFELELYRFDTLKKEWDTLWITDGRFDDK
jgi:hypothetical protein